MAAARCAHAAAGPSHQPRCSASPTARVLRSSACVSSPRSTFTTASCARQSSAICSWRCSVASASASFRWTTAVSRAPPLHSSVAPRSHSAKLRSAVQQWRVPSCAAALSSSAKRSASVGRTRRRAARSATAAMIALLWLGFGAAHLGLVRLLRLALVLLGLPARLLARRPCDRQVALGILEVAILQTAAGDGRRQTWSDATTSRRQLRHRAAHRRRAAVQEQLQPVLGDQPAGLPPILTRERVADGGHRLPLLRIPSNT